MPVIECKLRETDQTVGGTKYEFRTDRNGRHVAMVNDPRHIECFLACGDVYQIVPGEDGGFIPDRAPVESEKAIVNFPRRGRRRG